MFTYPALFITISEKRKKKRKRKLSEYPDKIQGYFNFSPSSIKYIETNIILHSCIILLIYTTAPCSVQANSTTGQRLRLNAQVQASLSLLTEKSQIKKSRSDVFLGTQYLQDAAILLCFAGCFVFHCTPDYAVCATIFVEANLKSWNHQRCTDTKKSEP